MKRFAPAMGLVLALMAAQVAYAGRVGGPGIDTFTAPAYQTVTYFETFHGGQEAYVQFDGDGSSILDVFVYDSNGVLIVNTRGPGDRGWVRWTPSCTARYRIEVRNSGGCADRFTLRTN